MELDGEEDDASQKELRDVDNIQLWLIIKFFNVDVVSGGFEARRERLAVRCKCHE